MSCELPCQISLVNQGVSLVFSFILVCLPAALGCLSQLSTCLSLGLCLYRLLIPKGFLKLIKSVNAFCPLSASTWQVQAFLKTNFRNV